MLRSLSAIKCSENIVKRFKACWCYGGLDLGNVRGTLDFSYVLRTRSQDTALSLDPHIR